MTPRGERLCETLKINAIRRCFFKVLNSRFMQLSCWSMKAEKQKKLFHSQLISIFSPLPSHLDAKREQTLLSFHRLTSGRKENLFSQTHRRGSTNSQAGERFFTTSSRSHSFFWRWTHACEKWRNYVYIPEEATRPVNLSPSRLDNWNSSFS